MTTYDHVSVKGLEVFYREAGPKDAPTIVPFSLGMFLKGIFGHALFVGLPVALFAKRAGGESVSGQVSRR